MAESSKSLPVRDASGKAGPASSVPTQVLDEATGELVSKTELKKRQKQREVERRKAEKAAAAPPKPAKKANAEDEEQELNPNQYFELRCRAIQALRASKQPNPYPHKFQVNTDLREFIKKYKDLERGEQLKDVEVTIGARMWASPSRLIAPRSATDFS